MRNFLIQTTTAAIEECNFILVGGLTGSGKTELLAQLENAIDLEGHAHHRGSSFGKHATPQPGQIDFENALAIDLLKKRARGRQAFVLAEEGRALGRCSMPPEPHSAMQQYPLAWLEDAFASRAERIMCANKVDLCDKVIVRHGPDGTYYV